ncbi:MAG TPA: UMP kinase [Candidatus Paceibacterota bacterium]
MRERVIVSVGGSLIVPEGIDSAFLADFRARILSAVEQGFTFYIVTGGGKTARRYIEAAHEVRGDLTPEDLDWLGIHATRLNGHLMRTLFEEQAYKRMVKNPSRDIESDEPIIVGAGWRPGFSTDYCAVAAAKMLGATRLVNLSNIDYVYDKHPKKYPDAKALPKVSWKDFRGLIPAEWDPGLSSPFDPVAAKEAESLGLEVAVMNGARLSEFTNYLEGKDFKGTVIS